MLLPFVQSGVPVLCAPIPEVWDVAWMRVSVFMEVAVIQGEYLAAETTLCACVCSLIHVSNPIACAFIPAIHPCVLSYT